MAKETSRVSGLNDVEISRVLLTSSNISLSEERQPGDELGYDLSLSGDVNLDTDLGAVTVDMTVDLKVVVNGRSEAGDPAEIASIVFTMRSHYLVGDGQKLEEASEGEVKEFATDKAFPDLEPFVREFIQSITGKMGFPPLLVPIGKAEADVSRNENETQPPSHCP